MHVVSLVFARPIKCKNEHLCINNVLVEKFSGCFVNEIKTVGESADKNTLSVPSQTDTSYSRCMYTDTHTSTPQFAGDIC